MTLYKHYKKLCDKVNKDCVVKVCCNHVCENVKNFISTSDFVYFSIFEEHECPCCCNEKCYYDIEDYEVVIFCESCISRIVLDLNKSYYAFDLWDHVMLQEQDYICREDNLTNFKSIAKLIQSQ